MNALVPQKDLEEIFDQIIREITPQAAGFRLRPDTAEPEGEIYTVYIVFEKGFHTTLSLCAERPLLIRMAQYMMQTEDITRQDMEDVAKEYINVLCGHVASRLFQLTRIPARFSVPAFQPGRYAPEGHRDHIVLSYSGNESEHAQLIHHVPLEDVPDSRA